MENNKFVQALARIAYFCFVRPFRWIYNKIALWIYQIRLEKAKKEAVEITRSTGKTCYVVFVNGKFYTCNRGGMLALAKKYKKNTGLSIDWRKLYVFESHVMTDAEKEEAERKEAEEKQKKADFMRGLQEARNERDS